jgi:CubicO group peptidase (beta-lactamase class C family)
MFPAMAQKLPETADSLAQAFLKAHPQAVLAVGVVESGKSAGRCYAGSGAAGPADEHTLFEIGGITETFTCILYARMAVRGELSSDAPVSSLLPPSLPPLEYRKVNCEPVQPVADPASLPGKDEAFLRVRVAQSICTPDLSVPAQPVLLCQLATHTSGFPDQPGNLHKRKYDPYSRYSKKQLYDFLGAYQPDYPVPAAYRHSMLGIALLGHALEQHARQPFDTLLTRRLLEPLGLHETHLARHGERSPLIPGTTAEGKPARPWTYDALAPAGALYSSLGDLLRFLEFNIRSEKDSLTDVLDFTHNGRILLNDRNGMQEEAALGWLITPLGQGRQMVWTSGLTGGYAAFIGFSETDHRGVVLLTNTAVSLDDAGRRLLESLLR